MAKIIRLRQEHIDQCVDELKKQSEDRLPDGQVEFKRVFTVKDRKARVLFTPGAWVKMNMLLGYYDSEVGWYCVASRLGDDDKDDYLIEDVVVYPQKVGAATVEMADPPEMDAWRREHIEDERYDRLYAHGHSHVRMGTGPSGVDTGHQRDILKMMNEDAFYIFMIWNKRLEHWFRIYDMRKNIQFEDADISVGFYQDGEDFESFLTDSKELVKPRVYKTNTAPAPPKIVSQAKTLADVTPLSQENSTPPAKKNAAPVQGMGWKGSPAYKGGGARFTYDEYDDEYWDPATGQWVDGDTWRWMQRAQYYT